MIEQTAATIAFSSDKGTEPEQFLGGIEPFAGMRADERQRIAASLTLAHYRHRDTILERLQSPGSLFLIVEGGVEESDAAGLIGTYGPSEAFDARSLILGRSEHSFVAKGKTSCYLLPAALFLALTRNNQEAREHYQNELSRRLDDVVGVQQQREAASGLISRLSEDRLHPAVFVTADATIGDAVRVMEEHDTTAVLVRRNGSVGIFTERDVRERHVLVGMPVETPIGDLATYDLQTIQADDFLFNALVVMTKRAIRHLVVKRGDEIVGLFEQADLLRHLSNSSHVIASQVDRAATVGELRDAGSEIPRLIRSMSDRGVKPRYIARVVTELNRKVFRRVFEGLTPPELVDQVCLIVMGSEGRGEQLLRTDQDNGLILRDAEDTERIAPPAAAFNQYLMDLGYPPCPGDVMVSNPQWARTLQAYKADIRRWVAQPSGEAFLNLAILCDASALAGDATLLDDLKAHIFDLVHAEEAFLGHFAKSTMNFPTPLNWFGRLLIDRDGPHASGIDIKKGGLFPIVHGVRSLALQYRLQETNTILRIQALSGQGPFSTEFAADLIEAFDFLSMLRLRGQYASLDRDQDYDNHVNIDQLSRFERNMLRASFKIVRDFKSYIRDHFRLQLLM
ncbi:MAG: putative nucleotidyltransferase substrate binding domain-containing protein [Rhodospirillales bacterium]